MKNLLFLSLLSLSTSILSAEIICDIKTNGGHTFSTIIEIKEGQKVEFADIEGLKFKLKSKYNSHYEMEIFDIDGPSRTYVEGSLKIKSDKVQYSLWTRDILLESSCSLFEN